jgi:glycosyltransferase involved in cell wall biosynthesis
MRVLIVGENASLRMGGEATYPYFYFKLLREQGIEAWLVGHARVRDELRELLPGEFDRIHLLDDSWLDRFYCRFTSFLHWKIREQTLGVFLHMVTQYRMRRLAAQLVRSERIDLVHQVYPISPKAPSAMYGFGVPVVIGPLSGAMDYPPKFQYLQRRVVRMVERVGRLASHAFNLLMPGKVRADSLIVANPQTRKALPLGSRGVVYEGISEVSVDLKTFQLGEPVAGGRPGDGKVRFVYLGRLMDWKAVDLLLDAFRKVVDQAGSLDLVLDILGDGPERLALEAQAGRLGLTDRVHFAGWVSADEAASRLRRSDVFVLPSLRESGGIVLMEAMALGLPVVATNWGGPGVHVDDASGIRVDPTSRPEFIDGLAEAMLRLARSPELRARMGRAARDRVESGTYTWDRKIERILEIYRETLDRAAAGRSQGPGSQGLRREPVGSQSMEENLANDLT